MGWSLKGSCIFQYNKAFNEDEAFEKTKVNIYLKK
jgi:hypothetical protein